MSTENENTTKTQSDYKKNFSEEKQKFGIEGEIEEISDEEHGDKMKRSQTIGDESDSNRIKLNNERKHEYNDYLSKKTDHFTKPDEYFEDVRPDTFLGFGESSIHHKHGFHKDVILAEKRQISHDELDDERKQEYQTYLSKNDYHFSKPNEYFEKVNKDSFLGFGEDSKQPTHGYCKHMNLDETGKNTIENLQNSLQHASISNYGNSSLFNFGQENDDKKELLLRERRQEYQDYLQSQNDKSTDQNDLEFHKDVSPCNSPKSLNAHQRALAALAHSPLHNQTEEANSQINREHNLQNQQDEKRRQHDQYFQELSQQIADKKQFNIEKANRERLEDEANAPLYYNQVEENYIQNREITLHDEKTGQYKEYDQLNTQEADNNIKKVTLERLEVEFNLPLHDKNEEYREDLLQQIKDNKQRKIAEANRERLEDEAIDRYEHNHAMFK